MVPVIDVAPLFGGSGGSGGSGGAVRAVASAIRSACESMGFFSIIGHPIDREVDRALDQATRRFFALPHESKMKIRMERGGLAWRGYFPLGGELTSGRPDRKEGIYFGDELPLDHPRVVSGTPLHGPNLWPAEVPELRALVLDTIARMKMIGAALLRAIAISLDLPPSWFEERLTREPVVLFRVFHYPPAVPESWGVGEHTDYGLLTLLRQDDQEGLEVKTASGWVTVPPLDDSLIVNLGDMLDRMTGGLFRSTPHRVQNKSARSRLAFPFFFDPSWDAELAPLPGFHVASDDATARWDRASVHAYSGRYSDYLTQKVARVFPALAARLK